MTTHSSRGRIELGLACFAVVLATACSSGSKTLRSGTAPLAAPGASSSSVGTSDSACRAARLADATGKGDVLVPGDIPDNQAYVTYRSAADGYRLSVPEGWGRTQNGAAVTFTDKFNSVRVDIVASPAAPSVASAEAAQVPALAASVACFQAGPVTTISRSSGVAVLLTYQAASAPDPVTGKVVREDVERYEFWKGGKEALITLSSAKGSDNVDPWRKVTDSFAWTP